MKRISAVYLMLVLVISVETFGQSSFSKIYKPGSKLYIYTRSGLTLRTKPEITGSAITVLAYGSNVIVEADTKPPVPFTNSSIQGAWVKVKAETKSGYVFDGFLSRFPPMSESNTERYMDDLTKYLKTQFPVKSEKVEEPKADSTYTYRTNIIFKNGTDYESVAGEGGAYVDVVFPASVITFKEVFLFARLAYPEFFASNKCAYVEDAMSCEIDENTTLKIKKEGPRILMQFGHSD